MPNLMNVKASIGTESTPGTLVTTTAALPIKGLPALDKKVERKADEVILGTSMEAGMYDVSTNVSGQIGLSPRACAGMGKLLKGNLGTDTVNQVGGCIAIIYTGASASCKIGVTGTTITSAVGALGSETSDAAFGSSGVVTLASYTTLGALQTAIAGYTGYSSTATIMGAAAASTTTPGPITITSAQAANKIVYVWFKSTTSSVYVHQITADLTSNERPSYTILKEGFTDCIAYTGCYVNELSLSAALKGMVSGSVTLLGFGETIGQTTAGLSLPSAQPLVFQSGTVTLAGKSFTYIRNFNFKNTNNMFADGYGIGSIDRSYVLKGKFAITGDFQLRLDANAYTERAKVFQNGTNAPLAIGLYGGAMAATMKEAMIIELPYLQYQAYDFTENSGILDAKIAYQAFNPAGSYFYDVPVTISLVTTDSAAY
jgi:Phage tail tube protein